VIQNLAQIYKKVTSKKLYFKDSQDLMKKGKNKKTRGRRRLTLARIVFDHTKNFREKNIKNGKERA
jgi:hypothetical protein